MKRVRLSHRIVYSTGSKSFVNAQRRKQEMAKRG